MKHLIVFDFDKTVADTSARNGYHLGVEEASACGVFSTLGNRGINIYEIQGGLQNREPRELIRDILQEIEPNPSQEKISALTQDFVREKLIILRSQIDDSWPMLYPGVKEFFTAVSEKTIPIDVAIVSSGHDDFIKTVFETNSIKTPENLVTSDTIHASGNSTRDKQKPHLFQLAIAYKEWARNQTNENSEFSNGRKKRPFVLYVGDDPKKDAMFAEHARIPFGLVPFSHPDYIPDAARGQFLVRDFNYLSDILEGNKNALKTGSTFSEILFGVPDHELFPPTPAKERPYQRFVENHKYAGSKERF